jgi:hypothetical protein
MSETSDVKEVEKTNKLKSMRVEEKQMPPSSQMNATIIHFKTLFKKENEYCLGREWNNNNNNLLQTSTSLNVN